MRCFFEFKSWNYRYLSWSDPICPWSDPICPHLPHLSLLQTCLAEAVPTCYVLHGRLSKKQRAATFDSLSELDEKTPRVLLATGRFIGEGFDHPPLATLVLAMPISWKGTLQQYTGRLHREHSEKKDVRIYDYIESDQPKLARMWDKRERGYRAMGYKVRSQ